MKEFCGYKSLDGSLHENQEEAEKADLRYKMKIVTSKIRSLSNFIDNFVPDHQKAYGNYTMIREAEDLAKEILVSLFANKKEDIKVLFAESSKLQKELDKLQEECNKSNPLRSHQWWLRLKWW